MLQRARTLRVVLLMSQEPATAGYRITNGLAIGSLAMFIQMVFGRV